MQKLMTANVGVFRTDEMMSEAVEKLGELRDGYRNGIQIDDKGKQFNSDLLEAWELGCLLELAEVTAVSALNRTESRGGHARDDYPKRDDANWLKHTLCSKVGGGEYRIEYKPVVLGRYQPKERVY
jgi:succinate dehydrogenase / fumarate reductase flavoprotein subunit